MGKLMAAHFRVSINVRLDLAGLRFRLLRDADNKAISFRVDDGGSRGQETLEGSSPLESAGKWHPDDMICRQMHNNPALV